MSGATVARSQWPRVLVLAGLGAALLAAWWEWHELLVWIAWTAAVVALARHVLVRGLSVSLLGALALLFMLFLGLNDLPGQLRALNASHRRDARFASFPQSEAYAQRAADVDASFVGFVSKRLPPGDTFSVAPGPGVLDDAPQRWFQFELLPSIELYGSPCSAKWLVLYGNTTVPTGVTLVKVFTFRRGFALARLGSPCTS